MKNLLQNISFYGYIKNSKNNKFPVFVDIQYDKHDFSILNCKIACRNPKVSQFQKFLNDNDFTISTKLNDNEFIFIDILYPKEIYDNVAELEISYFIKGFTGVTPIKNGKYIAKIIIDDVPAVHIPSIIVRDYLGSIKRKITLKDAISWETKLGIHYLGNFYSHEQIEYCNKDVRICINKTEIIIDNDFINPIRTKRLLEKIENEMQDIRYILSFISRKWVNWYEIDITFLPKEESQSNQTSFNIFHLTKRQKRFRENIKKRDYLFPQKRLKEGYFIQLLTEYKKSPYKERIRRSLIFLLTSHETLSIEASILAAYSALEVVTEACYKKLQIDNSEDHKKFISLYKEIKKEIKNLIKSIYEKQNWKKGDKIFQEFMSKRKELGRRSFASKLIDVITLANIEIIDIWYFHKEVNFDNKIKEIIKRRNDIIHTGNILDLHQLYCDLLRIQAITERLILFVLNCHDINKFAPSSYYELHSINLKNEKLKRNSKN